jgi:hypothetical protein
MLPSFSRSFSRSSWVSKNNLYIYLARLDKKGIKVLSAFQYASKVYPTRVTDLVALGLSGEVLSKVSFEQKENRMTHELYVESAPSFDQLKKSLAARGYSHLPIQQFSGHTAPSSVNKSALVTSESSMLRRASDVKR